MFASQRKQQILQILAVEKQVMSGELSQRFNVSEDSIRRDLRELAGEGKLQRVHGGALPVSAAIAPIETRKNVQIASKQAIARRAAALATRLERAYLASWVGQALPVLFEEEKEGLWRGHAPNYTEVFAPGEGLHNVIKEVKITRIHQDGLNGSITK